MSLKELRDEVGGKEIFARQWPATKALDMQIELLNACGGHIIPIIQGGYSFDDIVKLMASVPKSELTRIIKTFVFEVRIDGKELTSTSLDFIFNGNLLGLVTVFCKVVELQYKDFFVQGRATFPRKGQ